jgi:Tol biopolymer transport system component
VERPYVFAFQRGADVAGDPALPDTLWEATADGRAVRKVVLPFDTVSSPRWSPDGKKLAIATEDLTHSGDLVVMLAGGSGRVTLNGHGDCWSEIAWLPDGHSIACVAGPGKDNGLRVRLVATHGGQTRLFRLSGEPHADNSSAELNSIDWSPRGGRFAVDDDADGVYVVAANGAVLSTISRNGNYPRWSPDGTHILNLEKTLKGDTIVITSTTGTRKRVLLHVPIFDAVASAAWSPDGTKIAYIGTDGLHIVDVTTGHDQLLNRLSSLCGPSTPAFCADLDWRRSA